METISASNGRAPLSFNDKAMNALMELPWTGNIRELRNVIERLVILCDKEITEVDIDTYVKPLVRN